MVIIFKRYFIFQLISFGIIGSAQGQFSRDINLSVPSPQAATFELFTEMPVSLYTGLPNIEIPLYDIEEGELKIPIKLSYHASGFRPDIKPGLVAPNWSLNYGGSIQRKVKDRPDDLNFISNYEYSTQYESVRYQLSGFYFNGEDLGLMKLARWGQIEPLKEVAFPENDGNFLLGHRDTEPDEFSFSFPGGSGTFYFDMNRNLVVRSDDHIKVELHSIPFIAPPFQLPVKLNKIDNGSYGSNWRPDHGGSKTFSGFTVTDSKGIKYVYGGSSDYIEYSIDFNNQDRDFWLADAWQLSEIIHPNGEVVKFIYKRKAFSDQMSESLIWNIETKYQNTNTSILNYLGTIACGGGSSGLQRTFVGRLIAPLYIKEILTSQKKVVFNSSENYYSRHSNSFGFDYVNQSVNVYRHTHDYYFGLINFPGNRRNEPNGTNDFPYYYNYVPLPYVVDYVHENDLLDGLHTVGNMPYNVFNSNFSYFYGRFLYDERVNSIDIYNNVVGKKGVFEPEDIPNDTEYNDLKVQTIDLVYEESVGSTNRYNLHKVVFKTPANICLQQYMLEYFPFDGRSDYFNGRVDHWGYYTDTDIYSVSVNDLRDNHNKYFNARNPSLKYAQMNMLRAITYPTGGRTEFEYELNHAYFSVPKNRTDSLNVYNKDIGGLRIKEIKSYPVDGTELSKKFLYVKNYGTGEQQRSSGVLASEVQYLFSNFKTKAAEGDIFVTKTMFSSNSLIPGASATQGSHIGYSEVVELNSDGSYIKHFFTNFDNGHKDESELALIADLSPYNPYTSKELERGKEYRIEYYNSNQQITKRVETTFLNLNKGVNDSKAMYVERNKLCTGNWFESTAKYYTNYTYCVVPKQVETTEYYYDTNGNGTGSVTNIKDLTYYSHKNVKTITTTNSKGETIRTEYRYSIDLQNSSYTDDFGKSINTLASKNIIVPVETLVYKDNILISAEVNEYGLYEGCNNIAQQKGYYTWNKKMSGAYSILTTAGSILQKDPMLKEEVTVTGYNPRGRPQEVVYNGTKKVSYIWSYFDRYPLISLHNVSMGEVRGVFPESLLADMENYCYSLPFLQNIENSVRSSFSNAQIHSVRHHTTGLLSRIVFPSEQVTYFDYDHSFRLENVYDKDLNILKRFSYYQVTEENGQVYLNDPVSRTFYRQGCPTGFHGAKTEYVVPKGKYRSFVSQADANSMALDEIIQTRQLDARIRGACIPDGTYVTLCAENSRQVMNGSYRETYTTFAIHVYKDDEGRLFNEKPIDVRFKYQGSTTVISVTGSHSIGELLTLKELILPYPNGEEQGEYFEYSADVLNSTDYSIISVICGNEVDASEEDEDYMDGFVYTLVHFQNLNELCNYSEGMDIDFIVAYYYDDVNGARFYADAYKQNTVGNGYYTTFKTGVSGGYEWYKMEDGFIVETGVCQLEDDEDDDNNNGNNFDGVFLHGQVYDMIYFQNLGALCSYTSDMDMDMSTVYCHEDSGVGKRFYTNSTKDTLLVDGYYTFVRINDSNPNVWYKIIGGVIVDSGHCPYDLDVPETDG